MKVAILGGGQLARMLSLAAFPLGIETKCVDPTDNPCASYATDVLRVDFHDYNKIIKFISDVNVVTIETENIPHETLQVLQEIFHVFPPREVLMMAQDRLLEKQFCQQHNIPTTKFIAIDSLDELTAAIEKLSFPCVLKTRRFGYDGKGQYVLRQQKDIKEAWQALQGENLLLEEFIDFNQEISIIAAAGVAGEVRYYPVTENVHRQGILTYSTPILNQNLQKKAQDIARQVIEYFDYVGVLAIEFFVVKDQLIVNEFAPRVHNSGHWTIEGAATSQFENHIRAICNLPLGNCEMTSYTRMYNILGEMPDMQKVLTITNAHYHDYQKQAKPNRKLGHITLTASNEASLIQRCEQLEKLLSKRY